MFFEKLFIQDLTDKINIVDVVGARVKLKKTGGNFSGLCPFHNEKTPSFSVNIAKGFYHCFGCGASGSVISFVMQYENLPFVEAVQSLCQRFGIALPEQNIQSQEKSAKNQLEYQRLTRVMQKANDFYCEELKKSTIAQDYLIQRKLSPAVIEKYKIGYAPNSWQNFNNQNISGADLLNTGLQKQNEKGKIYDRLRDRITYPIFNNRGTIIGFGARAISDDNKPKYLNSPQTKLFDKSYELYGMYQILNSKNKFDSIILTEGYMDVISLSQHGFENAVSASGTAISAHQIQSLHRFCDIIIVCLDSDQAGINAALKITYIALPLLKENKQIKFITLPAGDDPDDYIQNNGAEKFNILIENSKSIEIFLLEHIKNQYQTDDIAGKNATINEVYKIINLIQDESYKKIFTEFFSRELGVNISDIQSQSTLQPKNATEKLTMTPIRKMLSLLIQNPEFSQDLLSNPDVFKNNIKGMEVLKTIMDDVIKFNLTTVASLDEHLKEYSFYDYLKKLLMSYDYFKQTNLGNNADKDTQHKIFMNLTDSFIKPQLRNERQKLNNIWQETDSLTPEQKNRLDEINKKLKTKNHAEN
ncbi:MAG: DNA primase [Gammaproteobacteria bacterium]|nr:MAG: DNA primase [Gammaproteobacteria bacterium]